ncbi:hypothetical protein DSECCO2_363730 [anaerobic digester metagenome]
MPQVSHSSSMLSRSGSSSSSSDDRAKKEVGGICLLSPTTITWSPRAIEPMASSGHIWEASSKITVSNRVLSRSRNWATDRGLMSMHGLSSPIRSQHSLSMLRMALRCRFSLASRAISVSCFSSRFRSAPSLLLRRLSSTRNCTLILPLSTCSRSSSLNRSISPI